MDARAKLDERVADAATYAAVLWRQGHRVVHLNAFAARFGWAGRSAVPVLDELMARGLVRRVRGSGWEILDPASGTRTR